MTLTNIRKVIKEVYNNEFIHGVGLLVILLLFMCQFSLRFEGTNLNIFSILLLFVGVLMIYIIIGLIPRCNRENLLSLVYTLKNIILGIFASFIIMMIIFNIYLIKEYYYNTRNISDILVYTCILWNYLRHFIILCKNFTKVLSMEQSRRLSWVLSIIIILGITLNSSESLIGLTYYGIRVSVFYIMLCLGITVAPINYYFYVVYVKRYQENTSGDACNKLINIHISFSLMIVIFLIKGAYYSGSSSFFVYVTYWLYFLGGNFIIIIIQLLLVNSTYLKLKVSRVYTLYYICIYIFAIISVLCLFRPFFFHMIPL